MNKLREISAKLAKDLLDNNKAILIDVREKAEHEMMHIPNVLLLPQSSFNVNQLPNLEGKQLIIMCKAGMRGEMICNKIMAETEIEPMNLTGGIMDWHYNGYL